MDDNFSATFPFLYGKKLWVPGRSGLLRFRIFFRLSWTFFELWFHDRLNKTVVFFFLVHFTMYREKKHCHITGSFMPAYRSEISLQLEHLQCSKVPERLSWSCKRLVQERNQKGLPTFELMEITSLPSTELVGISSSWYVFANAVLMSSTLDLSYFILATIY